MDWKSLFGGVSIGRDTSGNLKMAFTGEGLTLAVRAPNGHFYARDHACLKDVTDLTLDAFEGMVFKLPAATVKEGDVIVVSENPFSAVFVKEVGTSGKEVGASGEVCVLNPAAHSEVQYCQPANLFGQRFFVKATNLLESFGGGDLDNILPLLLLLGKNDRGSQVDNLLPLLLLPQRQGGGGQLNNPLLLALLLSDRTGEGAETMALLALGGGALGGGFPGLPVTSATKKADRSAAIDDG